ncbi:MAG: ArsR/SmtB family transcription factor [Anaerolineae bacterium]
MEPKRVPATADEAQRSPADVSDRSLRRAATLFRAAGDLGRLRVLVLLSDGELCVGGLAEALGDNMPTVSQRLLALRRQGLVARRREGKRVYYSLADQHVRDIVADGLAHAAEMGDER